MLGVCNVCCVHMCGPVCMPIMDMCVVVRLCACVCMCAVCVVSVWAGLCVLYNESVAAIG